MENVVMAEVLPFTFFLEIEAADSSETLVITYKTTLCLNKKKILEITPIWTSLVSFTVHNRTWQKAFKQKIFQEQSGLTWKDVTTDVLH
jgi:hypothetical protein